MKRVGVITSDDMLYRKIKLALRHTAEVSIIDAEESAAFPFVFIDERASSRTLGDREGVFKIGEGLDIPYPFSLVKIQKIIDGALGVSERLLLLEDSAILDGEKIHLSEAEYRLLSAIYLRRGEFASRAELIKETFGEGVSDGLLSVYIHYLREKLEAGGEKLIISSRKFGYKIDKKFLGGEDDA